MDVEFTQHFYMRFNERVRSKRWLCKGDYLQQLNDIENAISRKALSAKKNKVGLETIKIDISGVLRVVGKIVENKVQVMTIYVKE